MPQETLDHSSVSQFLGKPDSRDTRTALPEEKKEFYSALTPSTDKEMSREKAIEQLEKIAIFSGNLNQPVLFLIFWRGPYVGQQ